MTRIDHEMEEKLKQCQQDFTQYDQIFQNMIEEVNIKIFVFISKHFFNFHFQIRILQYESTEKPAFRS